jgi:hypothetical protein
VTVADTGWPEASVAIFGTLLLASVLIAVIWQAFATWRARMAVAREESYRRLAEEATAAQRATGEELERIRTELAQLREQTTAVERVLSQVD